MKLNRRELLVGLVSIFVGGLVSYAFTYHQIQSHNKLTARILSNAIKSMEASQNLAESCSEAYSTASKCVTNLSTCNLQEEEKKLDIFNTRRKHADE